MRDDFGHSQRIVKGKGSGDYTEDPHCLASLPHTLDSQKQQFSLDERVSTGRRLIRAQKTTECTGVRNGMHCMGLIGVGECRWQKSSEVRVQGIKE